MFTINNNMYINTSQAEHCYLLGYFWADAYFGMNHLGYWSFSFEIKHTDFLEIWDCLQSMGFTSYSTRVRENSSNPQSAVHAAKQDDMLFFKRYKFHKKELGCPLYFTLSEEMQKFFIKGFLDGDGSVSLDKNNLFRVGFNGPKEQNWDFLEHYCNSNSIPFSIYRRDRDSHHDSHKKKTHSYSIVEFTKAKDRLKFCDTLNHIHIGLSRKMDSYITYKNWFNSKPKSSIKSIISPGISLKTNDRFVVYTVQSIHGIYKYVGTYKTLEEAITNQNKFLP